MGHGVLRIPAYTEPVGLVDARFADVQEKRLFVWKQGNWRPIKGRSGWQSIAAAHSISERLTRDMGDVGPFKSIQSARARGEQEPPREMLQVLSSINMSLSVLDEQLRQSEVPSLVKVVELLQANDTDLATYLSSDSKGKLIPRFLAQLATQLSREHEFLRRECEQLARDAGELKNVLGLEAGAGTDATAKISELKKSRDAQAVSGREKSPAKQPGAPINA